MCDNKWYTKDVKTIRQILDVCKPIVLNIILERAGRYGLYDVYSIEHEIKLEHTAAFNELIKLLDQLIDLTDSILHFRTLDGDLL